jgi:muramoyltetrapeptide carboxypeptidase
MLAQKVETGSEILLLSPAFSVAEEVAQQAVRYWQAQGMRPVLMPHALGKHHAYSGTDAERLADLTAALEHPTAAAIHCLRGGYGFTRILDEMPLQALLAAHPKYLLGFSDITAGLLAWQAAGFGHLAVHAPMAPHLGDAATVASGSRSMPSRYAPDAAALATYLTKGQLGFSWQDPSATAQAGLQITAPITGGNLTLLAHSIGSKYPLRAAGHMLFIEEVGEQLYHTDRMLLQLRRAGALEGVVAVLLGHFTDMKDLPAGFGSTVQEMVQSHLPGVPIAAGLPAGHARPNWPVPFGVPLVLEATQDGWSLHTLETGA